MRSLFGRIADEWSRRAHKSKRRRPSQRNRGGSLDGMTLVVPFGRRQFGDFFALLPGAAIAAAGGSPEIAGHEFVASVGIRDHVNRHLDIFGSFSHDNNNAKLTRTGFAVKFPSLPRIGDHGKKSHL